ncbi:phosphatidylserine decarboxylase [Aster yellows witches'-broom phytoplasma AYWB]|uniref:Phosphatidylserine decarboxylase n=2 Tax=16SrI (Aster yellows group) TaxID=3042590 RepID=Q2NK05_AYWBP|nr:MULTISPECIES: phosphatidylserine decarboxylase [16SrI (Aster yellows group)]ABC65238.1 phosphatidylserine decarboxylase [Aster yellows witches'-broom phytoplasma AYWB]PEH36418.1 phosphatidylserine decarboxylase [New Jersey aster yellows phytoplasma]
MKIVNLEGKIICQDPASRLQKTLYTNLEKNFWKRLLLKILITKPISWLVNLYFYSPWSRQYALKIIEKHQIDLNLFEKQKISSYNDFFTRKYKELAIPQDNFAFISPCESKLSIYPIAKKALYCIKETNYSLVDLLQNPTLAQEYEEGYLLIFRLEPHDYHRYLFVDEGFFQMPPCKIKGKLHTVNPIAFESFDVFKTNTREYSILQTKNFGKIVQIEVGATLVGKIENYPLQTFSKGQEKGYFDTGGSTIIILVKKNIVAFDHRILEHTQKRCETQIPILTVIGKKITPTKTHQITYKSSASENIATQPKSYQNSNCTTQANHKESEVQTLE